jgi:flagellar biosynthesis/type III secretory pathway protein FliH
VQQRTGFTPLASVLRPARPAPLDAESAPAASASSPTIPTEYADALGAARRFRAGLRDALDVAVTQCLQRIARDVLARELRLAKPDVKAIVDAALESCGAENVLSIRANPRDVDALSAVGLELIGDETMRPGDITLMLRCGTIDLTLAARLENALALWNACGPPIE